MPIRRPNKDDIEHIVKFGGKPDDYLYDEEADEFIPAPKFGLGTVVRGLASAPLPALAARGGFLGGGAAVAPLGVATGGIASLAAGLTGAGVAGVGASYLQDKAIEYFSPETARTMALERVQFPKLSTALGLVGGAHTGGGSLRGVLNPALLAKEGPRALAKSAAIQGAANVGQQAVLTGDVDWTQAALGTLGGVATAAPSAGFRGFERNFLQNRGVPSTAVDRFAPAVVDPIQSAVDSAELSRSNAATQSEAARAAVDKDFLREAPVDWLRKVGDPLHVEVARQRDLGIPMTDEIIDTLNLGLSRPGGQRVVEGIMRQEVPKLAAAEAETATAQAARAVEARNADEAQAELLAATEAANKTAETQTARTAGELAKGGEAEAQKTAVRQEALKAISEERKVLKAERDSAADMLGELIDSEGGLKEGIGQEHAVTAANLKQAVVQMNAKMAALAERLTAMHSGKVDFNPMQPPDAGMNLTPEPPVAPIRPLPSSPDLPSDLDAMLALSAKAKQGIQLTPAEQRSVADFAMRLNGRGQGTQPQFVPEGKAQLDAQVAELHAGRRKVVYVTAGSAKPTISAGDVVVQGKKGILIFDKRIDDTARAEIKKFVAEGREEELVKLLEYPTSKALAAEAGPAARSVVTANAAGVPVKEQLAAPSEVPLAVSKAAVPPGGMVRVESPGDTLMAREAGFLRAQPGGKKKLPTEGKVGNEPRNAGVPTELLKRIIGALKRFTTGAQNKTIAPAIQRIAQVPGAEEGASRVSQMPMDTLAYAAPLMDHVNQATKGTTQADLDAVHTYRAELQDTGKSDIALTPIQWRLNKAISEMTILDARKREGGAYVKDFDENGATIWRPNEITPDYSFQSLKPDVIKVLKGNDLAAIQKIKERFYDWEAKQRGVTPDVARRIVDTMYFSPPISGKSNPNIMYDAVRYAQGVGLPPEFRANVVDATLRGLYRSGLDRALYDNIESRPEIGKLFGFTENGRGEKYPELILGADGKPVEPFSSMNTDLNAIFGSLVKGMDNNLFESATGAATSIALGLPTAARNFAQNFAVISETMKPSEVGFIAQGMARMLGKEARDRALRAGWLKPSHNLNQGISQSANDSLSRFAKAYTKITGAEKVEEVSRILAFDIAEQVAWNRMLTGDKDFFAKHGPFAWEKMDPAAAVRYAAVRLAGKQQGTYDFLDQPNALLPGANSGWKAFMSLSRWSVARSNNWLNDVFKPALDGDFGPLLKSTLVGATISAPLVSWFNQLISSRKPKELTYEEWFNLGKEDSPTGKRDTANMLLVKNALVGNMGIIADLALGANQMLFHKEIPRGYNNLAISMTGNVAERLQQFANALDEGKVTLRDIPDLGFELLRDNVQNFRALAPREDESGMREERLARHVGFLPEKKGLRYSLRDPWSETSAYRDNNLPLLSKIMENKVRSGLATGNMPTAPSTAIRSEIGVSPETGSELFQRQSPGQPGLPNYYNFINKAQGPEAAREALVRDANETIKRKVLFGRALQAGASNVVRSVRESRR